MDLGGPPLTRIRLALASTAALLLTAASASAVSVMNRDDRDRTVTVIEGSIQRDHILKPNAVVQDICLKGCLIRLDQDGENPYELEGSEVTSVEGGKLYDDEPDAHASPIAGDASQPSSPGK